MGADKDVRTASRALALAAAAGVHALFLVAFLWRLGATPAFPGPPVIDVELLRPSPKPPPRREPPPSRPAQPAASPVLHAPAMVAPQTTVAPIPWGAPPSEGVQRALRGALGCRPWALSHQSAEERRGCDERLAAVRVGGQAVRLNLDPGGHFAADAEPYLQRKPRNGCKVRAGGDAAPLGREGAATGVSCAWSF